MNDRFKFRLWDKENKTYYASPYGSFALSDSGELFWIESNCDCSELNTEDYVVEQCTGLKDKNGKLIFEGDVLDYDFVVVWTGCGWGFKNRYSGNVTPFIQNMTCFEITGNLNENRSF